MKNYLIAGMILKMYQVDAFTKQLFGGNPAAVCILENWLSDSLMQSIAAENNLAETAFAVKNGEQYDIRWFTPAVEVDLCGHATLATAHVLFNHMGYSGSAITFFSNRSGELRVTQEGDLLTLDFPVDEYTLVPTPVFLAEGLGKMPLETYRGKTDYMAVYSSQREIAELVPDFVTLNRLDGRGVIVTAPGDDCDFVSRFFAPQSGINEDPVTGSAHTTLTPYWAEQLEKTTLTAIQISERQGHLACALKGNRVAIGGHAVTFLSGELYAI